MLKSHYPYPVGTHVKFTSFQHLHPRTWSLNHISNVPIYVGIHEWNHIRLLTSPHLQHCPAHKHKLYSLNFSYKLNTCDAILQLVTLKGPMKSLIQFDSFLLLKFTTFSSACRWSLEEKLVCRFLVRWHSSHFRNGGNYGFFLHDWHCARPKDPVERLRGNFWKPSSKRDIFFMEYQ